MCIVQTDYIWYTKTALTTLKCELNDLKELLR